MNFEKQFFIKMSHYSTNKLIEYNNLVDTLQTKRSNPRTIDDINNKPSNISDIYNSVSDINQIENFLHPKILAYNNEYRLIRDGILNLNDINWLTEQFNIIKKIVILAIEINPAGVDRNINEFLTLTKMRDSLIDIIESEEVFRNAGKKYLTYIKYYDDEKLAKSLQDSEFGFNALYDYFCVVFSNFIKSDESFSL